MFLPELTDFGGARATTFKWDNPTIHLATRRLLSYDLEKLFHFNKNDLMRNKKIYILLISLLFYSEVNIDNIV